MQVLKVIKRREKNKKTVENPANRRTEEQKKGNQKTREEQLSHSSHAEEREA
jgi:hypothetical protein